MELTCPTLCRVKSSLILIKSNKIQMNSTHIRLSEIKSSYTDPWIDKFCPVLFSLKQIQINNTRLKLILNWDGLGLCHSLSTHICVSLRLENISI